MRLKNTLTEYGLISKIFHWLTAALLIIQIPLGFYLVDLDFGEKRITTESIHVLLGISIFYIVLIRLVYKILNPTPALRNSIFPGQKLIALGSSGPHSNGYSLVRKIIEVSGADVNADLNGKPIIDQLLEPTRIYVKSVLALLEEVQVSAISHITGGGFWENIPRVLPEDAKVVIDESTWEWPAIFSWLQEKGNVETFEMYRTFNCGVGLIVALPKEQANAAVDLLNSEGENAWIIGEIANSAQDEEQVVIN